VFGVLKQKVKVVKQNRIISVLNEKQVLLNGGEKSLTANSISVNREKNKEDFIFQRFNQQQFVLLQSGRKSIF
jgi:hypothetical protein